MPKDTKSSGYNKAPACESRGFGHKKEGENFDTPSVINAVFPVISNKCFTPITILIKYHLQSDTNLVYTDLDENERNSLPSSRNTAHIFPSFLRLKQLLNPVLPVLL